VAVRRAADVALSLVSIHAEHDPVALDPQTGIWSIFRYSDVHRALTDVAAFGNVLPGKPEDDPFDPRSASFC
jgi:hypothetical protein